MFHFNKVAILLNFAYSPDNAYLYSDYLPLQLQDFILFNYILLVPYGQQLCTLVLLDIPVPYYHHVVVCKVN